MNLSARLLALAKGMVADDVGALVAPFESVLKSLGFRPSVHNARTSKDFVFWILDLDPAKYELARMVVTFVPDKVEIVAGNLREDGVGEVEFDFSHPMRGYSPSALRRDIRSNLWTMGKISESKAASELLRIAKSIIGGDVNTLNGISNQAAKRYVNRILSEHTKGFFHDQSWEGVSRVWKALDDNGIDWTMTGNEYQKDGPSGMPTRKQWKFEVNFVNNKSRLVTLYGVLIASGAGSVDDVLSKYDLVSYVS